MSTDALPELQDAIVSWATVDALFADLAALAEVRELQLKGYAEGYATAVAPDLVFSHQALRSGAASAVQIRYLHQGRGWCDTILRVRTAEGDRARVVRAAWDATV